MAPGAGRSRSRGTGESKGRFLPTWPMFSHCLGASGPSGPSGPREVAIWCHVPPPPPTERNTTERPNLSVALEAVDPDTGCCWLTTHAKHGKVHSSLVEVVSGCARGISLARPCPHPRTLPAQKPNPTGCQNPAFKPHQHGRLPKFGVQIVPAAPSAPDERSHNENPSEMLLGKKAL